MSDMDAIHARITLCNLKARHLRMLDTKDWAGYGALLADDFELDITAASPGAPILRGRDVVVGALQKQLGSVVMAHQAHEPEIELKGDEAFVVWAMQDRITRSRMAGDPPEIALVPLLQDFALMDFHRAGEAIEEGRRLVRAQEDAIRAWIAASLDTPLRGTRDERGAYRGIMRLA